MKKIFIPLSVLLLFVSVEGNAQQFLKGSNVASVGIGLGSSILSYSGASQSPAIDLQYERGVWDMGGPGVISLGGYLGIKTYKYSGKYSDFSYDEKWNYTVIGVRSAYHYNGLKAEKIDVYGGIMLSYNILNYSYTNSTSAGNFGNSGSYGSTAGFSIYLGGRYFFTNNLAVFAELGYGVAYLSIGAAFKF